MTFFMPTCYDTTGPTDWTTKLHPSKSDGEEHYEVQAIRKHRVVHGELQFLVKWTGYDESENLWLTTT